METRVKTYLLDAIRMMMKPLVRLLINQGVSHQEFSEALKDVYVEAAVRHFNLPDRIHQSGIAIKTGLTRKEVRRVLDRALASEEDQKVSSRPERVLAGWHNDPRFTGPYGVPVDLKYEGEFGKAGFVDLVKTYSGDMSPKAMLQELVRGGSASETEGVIKVLRRDFEPGALSNDLIVRLGEIGHKFFSTAAANIEKTGQGSGYFDRLVYAERGCTENVIVDFDVFVKKHGQQFLEELDTWIAAHETDNDPEKERKDTGVYMVHYVETGDEKLSFSSLLKEYGFKEDPDESEGELGEVDNGKKVK